MPPTDHYQMFSKKIQESLCPSDYTNTTSQMILIGVSRGIKYVQLKKVPLSIDVIEGGILISFKDA